MILGISSVSRCQAKLLKKNESLNPIPVKAVRSDAMPSRISDLGHSIFKVKNEERMAKAISKTLVRHVGTPIGIGEPNKGVRRGKDRWMSPSTQ